MMFDDEEEEPGEDGNETVDGEAEVWCPYCGERVSITLDQGGAGEQEYIEDCPVCCRPWNVHVSFSGSGKAIVTLTESS
jgi:hypothetical protein